ncbi:TonB-dependent receptor [Thalassotalea loyana]|uniref:TonB-dependent receptor n=1 Tax=Thalassotalea loyana TaxID=280483 RepID=A0ABQ6HCE0_9GAMM|nr:TonB-dependent receptor [Thalassotalea loyana]GLX85664.1 TonB-dependent receptor [Thalassotalea loyana]
MFNYNKKITFKKSKICLALMATTTLSSSFTIVADDETKGLERITVTAQKRVQSLQEIPNSITAMSGEDLVEQQATDLLDLSESLPNVHLTETSSSKRIFIRGIGSGTNSGFEQSVALFKDGIYMGRGHQAKFPLIDVERVEVVKGPQAVMFGKNATAGAISITSRRPLIDSDEIEGNIDASYGTDQQKKLTAVANIPVSDDFAIRLAGFSESADGYLNNLARNQDEVETKASGFRISALWQASDKLEILGQVEHSQFESTGSRYQYIIDSENRDAQIVSDPTNPANVGYRSLLLQDSTGLDYNSMVDGSQHPGGLNEGSDTDVTNAMIQLTYQLEQHELVSISTYSDYHWDSLFDADYSELSLIKQTYIEDFEQFTQELRISSDLAGEFNYIAGVYFQKTQLSHPNDIVLGASVLIPDLIGTSLGIAADFEQDQTAYSIFASGNWRFSPDWQLNLGLRYQKEEKEVSNKQTIYTLFSDITPEPVKQFAALAAPSITASLSGAFANDLVAERDESHLSPSVSLQYRGIENTMLFANASIGYKGGGFDGSGLNSSQGSVIDPNSGFEYEDEKATAYEIGAKSELIEGIWELNATLFLTDYDDLQVSEFNGNAFVVANAAQTRVQGAEFESRWAINENWQLNAQLALLDFEYQAYDSASPTVRQSELLGMATQDLTGKTGAFAPKYSGNIELNYQNEIGEGYWFDAAVNVRFVDDQYLEQDLDPVAIQESYQKINARIAISSPDEHWQVALLAKNLTDEQTFSQANDVPVISYAHRFLTERGREYHLQLSYRF